jgi:hypothetical protein
MQAYIPDQHWKIPCLSSALVVIRMNFRSALCLSSSDFNLTIVICFLGDNSTESIDTSPVIHPFHKATIGSALYRPHAHRHGNFAEDGTHPSPEKKHETILEFSS